MFFSIFFYLYFPPSCRLLFLFNVLFPTFTSVSSFIRRFLSLTRLSTPVSVSSVIFPPPSSSCLPPYPAVYLPICLSVSPFTFSLISIIVCPTHQRIDHTYLSVPTQTRRAPIRLPKSVCDMYGDELRKKKCYEWPPRVNECDNIEFYCDFALF